MKAFNPKIVFNKKDIECIVALSQICEGFELDPFSLFYAVEHKKNEIDGISIEYEDETPVSSINLLDKRTKED